MPKVLHISTHMGGGIGNALSSIIIESNNNGSSYEHEIFLLEQPVKTQYIEKCINNGIKINVVEDVKKIQKAIEEADIVQISWTHHPKMNYILNKLSGIRARLILWSHVSGCNYPMIPYALTTKFQYVFFTSLYSYENMFWTTEEKKSILKKSSVIYGCGNFTNIKRKQVSKHEEFRIGYIGTLNFSKLHPRFIDFCKAIDIPDMKIIMVGDIQNKDSILAEARKKGIEDKIEFKGFVTDINDVLNEIDVFGYPLNPYHYGTTENAIIEAMYAEIPVVLLNQCTEKYIVEHMKTGMLCDGIEDYANNIKFLYRNPKERQRIGREARKYVAEKYSLKKNIGQMEVAYDQVIEKPKEVIDFHEFLGEKPYEWFLSCVGKEKSIFIDSLDKKIDRGEVEEKIRNCEYILRESTKSSIIHFSKYFPSDQVLNYWKEIIQNR